MVTNVLPPFLWFTWLLGWIRQWMLCNRLCVTVSCPDWISVFVYVVADWLAPVAWRNAAAMRAANWDDVLAVI